MKKKNFFFHKPGRVLVYQMSKFSTEERTKIVEFYYRHQHSIVQTQRTFKTHFKTRKFPTKPTILQLIQRFQEQGSVADLPRTGRPRSVRTDLSTQRVRESIEKDPKSSTRRRSQELGLSRTTLQRIQTELGMHPYKIQVVQQLKPGDYEQRMAYSTWIQEKAKKNRKFLDQLIMSDESHFYLNGVVNRQNTRFWGTENPMVMTEHELHPQKVTVWCGVTSDKVIGPYFFEDASGTTVTVNAARYQEMIEKFVGPQLKDMPKMWWQQDGAPAHTAKETMKILKQFFGDRLLSKNAEIEWPARSPDLTAPDFFLWGYLKSKVYANKPETLQQLKQNICEEILEIQPETLKSVMKQVLKRARVCEAESGGYLRDIVFKK